jgi:hypothetical protein
MEAVVDSAGISVGELLHIVESTGVKWYEQEAPGPNLDDIFSICCNLISSDG